jgi:hypothetical protein
VVKLSQIITYKGGAITRLGGFEEMMVAAMTEAMVRWHRQDLPHHFDTVAAVNARYPGVYKRRTTGYMIAKARRKGHQQMLMWSGQSAANVMSQITISGTSRELRGRMKGANRAFNFSGVDSKGRVKPLMQIELNYVNDEEWRALMSIVEKRMKEFMDASCPVLVSYIA